MFWGESLGEKVWWRNFLGKSLVVKSSAENISEKNFGRKSFEGKSLEKRFGGKFSGKSLG